MVMPEYTDKDRQRDDETHEAVITMRAFIFGLEGKGGLAEDVREIQMEVKNMTIRTTQGDRQVADILNDVEYLKPKIKRLTDDIHGKDGITDQLSLTKIQMKDDKEANSSRNVVTTWVVGIGVALLLAILGFLIAHIEKGG
jgi:hypothetical protein